MQSLVQHCAKHTGVLVVHTGLRSSYLSTATVLSLANAVRAIRHPIPLHVHEHQNVPDV